MYERFLHAAVGCVWGAHAKHAQPPPLSLPLPLPLPIWCMPCQNPTTARPQSQTYLECRFRCGVGRAWPAAMPCWPAVQPQQPFHPAAPILTAAPHAAGWCPCTAQHKTARVQEWTLWVPSFCRAAVWGRAQPYQQHPVPPIGNGVPLMHGGIKETPKNKKVTRL
jgi:hypothetical protein